MQEALFTSMQGTAHPAKDTYRQLVHTATTFVGAAPLYCAAHLRLFSLSTRPPLSLPLLHLFPLSFRLYTHTHNGTASLDAA